MVRVKLYFGNSYPRNHGPNFTIGLSSIAPFTASGPTRTSRVTDRLGHLLVPTRLHPETLSTVLVKVESKVVGDPLAEHRPSRDEIPGLQHCKPYEPSNGFEPTHAWAEGGAENL